MIRYAIGRDSLCVRFASYALSPKRTTRLWSIFGGGVNVGPMQILLRMNFDMPRYVVLLHDTQPCTNARRSGPHFDWMFDNGRGLWTWAIEERLLHDTVGPVNAVRLADHRREYLDYEGPVSGNRGSVTQVEGGDFELIQCLPERYEFRVEGERCGTIVFQRILSEDRSEFRSDRWNWLFFPTRADAN
jgi:hypothetical protein